MSIRQDLSELRGIDIELRRPLSEVPCIETSDKDKLCQNPLVTVRMLTYNHGPYVRQAIESVMMQKTNFDFELIIGEDASSDDTRHICFEMQKKYPERIRVLWSENNVYKMNGNSIRIQENCRGVFYAFCEGDDYWLDDTRLQRQVDIMQANPSIVCCWGEQKNLDQNTGHITEGTAFTNLWKKTGLIPRQKFAESECLVAPFTALVRASALKEAYSRFEIFSWNLHLGDLQMWRGLSQIGDFYFFTDYFAVYRNHDGGVTKMIPTKVNMDAGIVKVFFGRKCDEFGVAYILDGLKLIIRNRFFDIANTRDFSKRKASIDQVLSNKCGRNVSFSYIGVGGMLLTLMGAYNVLHFYFRVVDKVMSLLLK